jgi:uncharacterized Fe-S cluster-containing MiaB family protein
VFFFVFLVDSQDIPIVRLSMLLIVMAMGTSFDSLAIWFDILGGIPGCYHSFYLCGDACKHFCETGVCSLCAYTVRVRE